MVTLADLDASVTNVLPSDDRLVNLSSRSLRSTPIVEGFFSNKQIFEVIIISYEENVSRLVNCLYCTYTSAATFI